MRPGIFTGQVQQGGASSLGGLFESSTGANGEKIFQIMNAGSPIFYALHDIGTGAYPSSNTVDSITAPVILASQNNTNATCTGTHATASATNGTIYSERYDDVNLANAVDFIMIARDAGMSGTYVFGDLTITVGSSGVGYYILYSTVADGLIAFEQWGSIAAASSRTITWPYTGTAPSHCVATPNDSGSLAIATTRDVNALGATTQAFSHRYINNGFLATEASFFYNFYSKGVYTATYGTSEIECGVGYIKFKEAGVVKRVVTGYQNNTGTTAYQIISFPTTTITTNPTRIAMCTGSANRKVCMTVDISTSQCQYKTWDRTISSAQGVNIIAMEHLGS